jgi:hypothetical protein
MSQASGWLCIQVTNADGLTPLLEVKLELGDSGTRWSPALAAGSPGVRDMLEGWLQALQEVGSLVQRLDAGEGDSPRCTTMCVLCSYLSILRYTPSFLVKEDIAGGLVWAPSKHDDSLIHQGFPRYN